MCICVSKLFLYNGFDFLIARNYFPNVKVVNSIVYENLNSRVILYD